MLMLALYILAGLYTAFMVRMVWLDERRRRAVRRSRQHGRYIR